MVGLGWKSLGVLELTALPSLDKERWVPMIRETDVLLVDGGDAAYLCHWMRASGLADLLPSLRETVWVGVSAGSMVMTPRIGEDFVNWHSPAGDRTLGVVDFSIFPHVENPDLPENTMAAAERWAAGLFGTCVCDRRRDRHQGGRRHRRDRLRGALEAAYSQPRGKLIGARARLRQCARMSSEETPAPSDDDPLRAGDCPGTRGAIPFEGVASRRGDCRRARAPVHARG
jgi:Peptidase family S51